MKRKLIVLMLFIIAGSGIYRLSAQIQSMVVKMRDGAEYFKSLSALQKFSFSGNNLVLSYKISQTEAYSLTTISKLYFSTITGITDKNNKGSLSIYPNPAENQVYFQNMPEGISSVSICRMDGKLVFSKQISSGESVNVSSLIKGLYLMKVNNQVFKLIKL
jgi:hypothetical protein